MLMYLVKACCEMSRRDGAIVAWHEVPGTAPPQKSRPVGYGVIRAGVGTDSMIGVTKFRIQKLKTFMLYDFWEQNQRFVVWLNPAEWFESFSTAGFDVFQ